MVTWKGELVPTWNTVSISHIPHLLPNRNRLCCSSLTSTSLQATTVSVLIWEMQTYCQMHSLLIQCMASLLLLDISTIQSNGISPSYRSKTQAPVPKAFAAAEILYKDKLHKPQRNPTVAVCRLPDQIHSSITATHMQHPCFQQTSDQQSNISLHFRQSK